MQAVEDTVDEKREGSRRGEGDRRAADRRAGADRRERIVAVSVERRSGPRRWLERRTEVRRRVGDRHEMS